MSLFCIIDFNNQKLPKKVQVKVDEINYIIDDLINTSIDIKCKKVRIARVQDLRNLRIELKEIRDRDIKEWEDRTLKVAKKKWPKAHIYSYRFFDTAWEASAYKIKEGRKEKTIFHHYHRSLVDTLRRLRTMENHMRDRRYKLPR
jgi:hypothetical protein